MVRNFYYGNCAFTQIDRFFIEDNFSSFLLKVFLIEFLRTHIITVKNGFEKIRVKKEEEGKNVKIKDWK